MKDYIDLTESAGRDALEKWYEASDCTDDNEKYLVGTLRVDVDELDYADRLVALVTVFTHRDGMCDLHSVQKHSEPYGTFVLDDLESARALADFIVSHARVSPPFDEMWEHVSTFWEQL